MIILGRERDNKIRVNCRAIGLACARLPFVADIVVKVFWGC
jgi:hypothetical protein